MTSAKIAVLPTWDHRLVNVVKGSGGQATRFISGADGLVWTDSRDAIKLATALTTADRLRWVQTTASGVEALACLMQSRPELAWTSTKGATSHLVAEHAIALALACAKRLPSRMRATRWGAPGGRSLFGANVVIVGAGEVSRSLTSLLEPFGCSIATVRRTQQPVAFAHRSVPLSSLPDVLVDADVVFLAAPLTSLTRGLFDRDMINRMRREAVLVNVSRGSLVDSDALVDAVRNGVIMGAGLDTTFPEPLPEGHPLWGCENVIITPHTAAAPELSAHLVAEHIAANVRRFVRGEQLLSVIDVAEGY